MKHAAAVLFALAIFSPGLALAENANPLVEAPGDNPDNWCRNGQFPSMSESYKVAKISKAAGMQGDDDGCPSLAAKCEASDPLKAGALVVISKTYKEFTCTFDPRDGSAGWIPTDNLDPVPAGKISDAVWLGKWSDGYNSIEISRKDDKLHVSGHAQWEGMEGENGEKNIHVGEMDFDARPEGDRLVLTEDAGDGCAAELVNLGRYLVVRDNSNCGGMNVRFNSVYFRKK